MDIVFVVGIVAGALTSISLLPQLVKICKDKKVEDVSLWMLILLLAAISMWVVYGVLKKDIPIIITNAVSLVINLITIFLRIKYKK